MEESELKTRAHALSLLKEKLSQSRKARRRGAVDTTECDKSAMVPSGPDPQGVSRQEVGNAPEIGPQPVFVEPAERDRITPPPVPPRKTVKKLVVKWSCTRCQRECIPIREESRCLCGHRYKEHPSTKDDPRVVKNKALAASTFHPFACTAAKCPCKSFYYVVAEGAWILRCRCKHKHTEHDASGKPFMCKKPKCSCDGFASPWVCNCDHPWNVHVQETMEKEFQPLDVFQDQFLVDELNNVQRTDLRSEPLIG